MLRLLDRYVLTETLMTWLAVTGVLLFILISNQFARVLGQAAEGNLPRDAVFLLLGLSTLNYLTILVPVGLFLAVMLALGRLYKDSEMAAIGACGVSPQRLLRPLMLLAGVLAVLLAWLSLSIAPWAANEVHLLKRTAKQDAQVTGLEAGRFRSAGDGRAVFYAEAVDADGRLRNVFLQRRKDDVIEVALAARGEQVTDPDTGVRSMVLYDGERYEGVPGTLEFQVVRFAEHGIPIRLPPPDTESDDPDIVSTAALLAAGDREAMAELQWRLSIPLSAIVLVLLALPLSRTSPRQGRYGKLALAVLVYILYSNFLGAARVWVEQGSVPTVVGLWWVHLLAVGIALQLLAHQGGGGLLNALRRGRP
ncbi:MAG: LPS export ABC transporter permease LptF [Pseudomonadota bacterium]